MRMGISYLTTMLGAAGAAVATVAAPTAPAAPAAAPVMCRKRRGTVCQSPGNIQINDAPPPVQFYPYGGEAFLL